MIYINKEKKEFHLRTKNSSYIFNVMQNEQLGHLYYGSGIKHRESFSHLFKAPEFGIGIIAHSPEDPAFSLEYYKQEYPSYGRTDFRKPAHKIKQDNSSRITDFKYKEHTTYFNKKKLEGLPSTYGKDDEVESLEISLFDDVINCQLILTYSVFYEKDIITRSAKLINHSNKELEIESLMSASFDLPDYDYEMITLPGAWGRERNIVKRKLEKGSTYIDSTRGTSSVHNNPFLALKRKETTEHTGEVYALSLIYSGNFLAHVEVDHFDATRVMIGINPFDFSWKLVGKSSFTSPEAVMTYSNEGLNKVSQNFHSLIKENIMRGEWKDKERPILVNNWEATYFNFNEEKIVEMSKIASEVGFELFVLDDGWFGKRNDDKTSLGDWFVNKEKLPGGLERLAKKVNENGLMFGVWFEPEMISKESQLYKDHPDWLLSVEDRVPSPGRNQFTLDLTKKEVREYIINILTERLSEANISYVKWDMNRNMTEIPSKDIPHKYMLGLYEILEEITSRFPNILFEGCASGGGRFDLGMLHYMPQTWTSDNTDAVERLKIQYGTSLAYPLLSMGAHVSDIPNHQTARKTTLKMRNNVAMFGSFGYELDVTKFSEEDKKEVKAYLDYYKENRKLLQFGDFVRLKSPFESNSVAWMVVSKEKDEAIVGYYEILAENNPSYNKKIILKGLDPEKKYKIDNNFEAYGDELMSVGIVFKQPDRYFGKDSESLDFSSKLIKIKEIN